MKAPGDRDGAFTLVRDVRGRTEAPERSIGGTQACEEYHVRPLLSLADISASGVTLERRHRLALQWMSSGLIA